VGLTLIQRSSGLRPPKNPKIALVLAGGAVSGGAFKVGGLKALDEFLVGRKVNELDTYIGLSAGAFLATSLAAGITPDEMIEALEGTSRRIDQLRPIDFYSPNIGEVIGRATVFGARLAGYLPGLLLDLLSVLPDLPERTLLHSGPAISWDRMCGPHRRAAAWAATVGLMAAFDTLDASGRGTSRRRPPGRARASGDPCASSS